jgi:MFS family permease
LFVCRKSLQHNDGDDNNNNNNNNNNDVNRLPPMPDFASEPALLAGHDAATNAPATGADHRAYPPPRDNTHPFAGIKQDSFGTKDADGSHVYDTVVNVDPRPSAPGRVRWVAMAFICLLTFAQAYVMDFPGAIGVGAHGTIQQRFHAHGKKYDHVMNQGLYSVFSWPNTVFALVGGMLIDRYLGLRRATVVFAGLLCAGGWLFYVGVHTTQYPLMMFARFCLGIGAESMGIAQSCYVARYFADGRGIALAFGVTITACRSAATANFFFSPRVAAHSGVTTAILIGAFVTCLPLLGGVALVFVDGAAESRGHVAAWARDTTKSFKLSAVLKLPASSLLLAGVCAFVYGCVFPFMGIARDFFVTMYDLSGTEGSTQAAYYQLACAVGSPVVGYAIDRTGFSVVWLAASCLCFIAVHLTLALTAAVPAPAMMVAMGFAYAIFVSALWPACPKTVDPLRVGLAYGVMASWQNTLLAATPLVTGTILDANEAPHNHTTGVDGNATTTTTTMKSTKAGYQKVEFVFIGLAVVAFLLSLALWAVQRRIGGTLQLSRGDADARVMLLLDGSDGATADKGRHGGGGDDDDDDDVDDDAALIQDRL